MIMRIDFHLFHFKKCISHSLSLKYIYMYMRERETERERERERDHYTKASNHQTFLKDNI